MNIWGKTLYKGESKFNGPIKVVEFFGGNKRLFASGYAQSRSLNEKGKSEFYWDAFVDNVGNLPAAAEILILGLGAGTSASSLRNKFPKANIDGVEIDPLMVELGKEYFDLDKAQINIFVEDGKTFVKKSKKKYDFIGLDMFVGSSTPDFVFQEEFFEDLKKLMKKDTLLITNKIYEKLEEINEFKEFFQKHFEILNNAQSSRWDVPGNLILYGRLL